MWIRSRHNLINADWVYRVYIDEYSRKDDKPIYGLYVGLVKDTGMLAKSCLETYVDLPFVKDAMKHVYQCIQEGEPVCFLPKEGAADIC